MSKPPRVTLQTPSQSGGTRWVVLVNGRPYTSLALYEHARRVAAILRADRALPAIVSTLNRSKP